MDYYQFLAEVIALIKKDIINENAISEAAVFKAIYIAFQEIYGLTIENIKLDSTEAIVDYLKDIKMTEDIKWGMLNFFSKPLEQLHKLTLIINDNKKAYQQ